MLEGPHHLETCLGHARWRKFQWVFSALAGLEETLLDPMLSIDIISRFRTSGGRSLIHSETLDIFTLQFSPSRTAVRAALGLVARCYRLLMNSVMTVLAVLIYLLTATSPCGLRR